MISLKCLLAVSLLSHTDVSDLSYLQRSQCNLGSELFYFDWLGTSLKGPIAIWFDKKPEQQMYLTNFQLMNPMSPWYQEDFPGMDKLRNPSVGYVKILEIKF